MSFDTVTLNKGNVVILSILFLEEGICNVRLSNLLSNTAGIQILTLWPLVLFPLGASSCYSFFPMQSV